MATEVAVVIGNYEGERVLPDCLESLARQTHVPTELVVVDAGSRDRSTAVAERAGARVLCCSNEGLGYLYNRGAAVTRAKYVLFLNNDVALEPGCIERLSAALDADPSRFAADPRQLDWAGSRTIHARTTLAPGRLFYEFLPGLHLDPGVPADEVVETVSAHGAAMLVRRRHFEQLEGFDATFFMEWEDLDLCWRAWLRGWSSVYVPTAVVRHHVGAVTSSRMTSRRSASSHHNLIRFALKCLPARESATVLFGEVARLPRHPIVISKGLLSILGELPQIARLRRSIAPDRAVYEQLLALEGRS